MGETESMKKRNSLGAFFLAVLLLVAQMPRVQAEEVTEVRAKSAILVEAETGTVLYEMNARERRACGSVTKLMSLLLFMEAMEAGKYSLEDVVTVSEFANSMGGSEIWLEVGEQMTVEDLLKSVIIQSANDSTVALAEFTEGSEEAFLAAMNRRAAELGMNDTHYLNTTGFDEEGQYTTAYDLSLVARELIRYKKIFDYTTVWMDELRGGKTMLTNTNKLLKTYSGITGLKTGTTDEAGNCFCGTAERDGMTLISVVLGSETSEDRFASTRRLLDHGFANWAIYRPDFDTIEIPEVAVNGGMKPSVCGEISRSTDAILVPKGSLGKVQLSVSMAENVVAPVEQGQTLGNVQVLLEGKQLCQYPVLAPEKVDAIGLWEAFGLLWRAFLKI